MRLLLIILATFTLGFIPAGKNPKSQNLLREGKDFALFFAIEDYQNFPKLKYPIDEVEAIEVELRTKYAFQTEIVRNPSLIEIYQKLNAYREKGEYVPDAQLFILFSGHGTFLEGTREGFFVPVDGEQDDELQLSYLPFDRLKKAIDAIPCRHILLAIDACYSGTIDDQIASRNGDDPISFERPGQQGEVTMEEVETFLKENLQYQTRYYLTSGGKEKTPDRSQFAQQLLDGLRSTSPQDPILTYIEIQSYLEKASPRPRAGTFGINDPGINNFCFVRDYVFSSGSISDFGQANPPEDFQGAYIEATDCGTRSCLQAFVDNYAPNSYTPAVKAQLDRLILVETKAWEATQKARTLDAYRKYLKSYPEPLFQNEADSTIEILLVEAEILREKKAWESAHKQNNLALYNAYLIAYPSGTYSQEAKVEKQKLEQKLKDQAGIDSSKETELIIPLPQMKFILGGSFSQSSGGRKEVSSFLMSETEITFEQFDFFCEQTGRTKPDDEGWGRKNRPVINVSWDDAVAYCLWLSEEKGQIFRLPTQVEWEYVIIWDPTNSLRFSSISYSSGGVRYAKVRKASEIKTDLPNKFGLYDMLGNVWEWSHDIDEYNDNQRIIFKDRTLVSNQNYLKADREGASTHIQSPNLGFRIVLIPE
ncbi:MAG: SUMF1/EgtB/PvdO family nonheme iron enzyme [Bacteroidota bacterium]